MSTRAQVLVHSSQFPGRVRADLLESLRSRRVNHKFHYDSVKQTRKWLALHQAYSPSRTDAECSATYERGFQGALARITSGAVHLVGLGCGGGQKDARMLAGLRRAGRSATYTPSDVSVAMVLVARETAAMPEADCHPLVCDLGTAEDLPAVLDEIEAAGSARGATRLVTFFGMIPNFDQGLILQRLSGLLRPSDLLLFSANLAPGPDYAAGVEKILPLYDNDLTRDWLMTFLLDLGAEKGDGEPRFSIEEDAGGLRRVAAWFHFQRARTILVDEECFEFKAGDRIRLFFSYRHTVEKVRDMLAACRIEVRDQWITASEEEGVFLCVKTP
jgi:uncharacterized SAM-dependent methyltransferase